MNKPRKTFTIRSTVTARRYGSPLGDLYRYDLDHPDGTTDTDRSRKQAVKILTDRYPKSNWDALVALLRAAEEDAYKRNPDRLAEAQAEALRNQLTTGRSWLPKQDPPTDPPPTR